MMIFALIIFFLFHLFSFLVIRRVVLNIREQKRRIHYELLHLQSRFDELADYHMYLKNFHSFLEHEADFDTIVTTRYLILKTFNSASIHPLISELNRRN